MRWSDRTQVIVNTLAGLHPELVQGDDEARRRLTGLFAEQCRFEFGSAWGRKRYGGGPPSADVVAYKENSIFVGWDTQLSGGVIAQFPDSIDLSLDPEQKFIEVEPINHLGADPVPGPEPPPNGDLDTILQAIDDLRDLITSAHSTAQQAVDNTDDIIDLLTNGEPVIDFPDYEGSFRLNYLGQTRFTLTSKS